VRTPGGTLCLDAQNYDLALLDEVTVDTGDAIVRGTVVVTPDQLLRPPAHTAGTITEVMPRWQPDPGCDDLPGADLPPLGTMWIADGEVGMIVRLDPVGRSVTVRQDDGREVTFPLTP
jgi:hypothetical protein